MATNQPLSRAFAFHVMAKPIGPRCNLDCKYCYYLEKAAHYPETHRFRMADDVLDCYIRDYVAAQVSAGIREIWFSWQGGEPTMLGREYFERIVALQARHCPSGHRIRNALQTNGTLIDADWAQFLHDQEFLVGISIDGPPALHDRYRRDRRDLPSSDRVLAGLDQLLRHRVEVNILAVVNNLTARQPLEVYRYLRGLGVEFLQFIPVVERRLTGQPLAPPPQPGAPDAMVTPWSVRPADYGRFLCAVFDEWRRHDVGRVFVQLFDVQLAIWMGKPASLCIYAETCGKGLALEHNGDLYACDHYVYPEYRLGNIAETPIGVLADLPVQRQFGSDKQALLPETCRQCQWKFACNGGCPKHRFMPSPDNGGERLNYFCQSHKMFFAHAAPHFDTMAQLIRMGEPPARIMQMLPQSAATRIHTARNAPCPCGSGRKHKHCCG